VSGVKVGQVWADNDWRNEGRTLRVESVDETHATCTVLTNSTAAQERLDRGQSWDIDTRGKSRRILLRRFRPTSTGYRLVSERAS
jgi:hypothetical protein